MLDLKTVLFKYTFDVCFILSTVQQTITFQTRYHWNSHKPTNGLSSRMLILDTIFVKSLQTLQAPSRQADDGIYQILFQYVKAFKNITH